MIFPNISPHNQIKRKKWSKPRSIIILDRSPTSLITLTKNKANPWQPVARTTIQSIIQCRCSLAMIIADRKPCHSSLLIPTTLKSRKQRIMYLCRINLQGRKTCRSFINCWKVVSKVSSFCNMLHNSRETSRSSIKLCPCLTRTLQLKEILPH